MRDLHGAGDGRRRRRLRRRAARRVRHAVRPGGRPPARRRRLSPRRDRARPDPRPDLGTALVVGVSALVTALNFTAGVVATADRSARPARADLRRDRRARRRAAGQARRHLLRPVPGHDGPGRRPEPDVPRDPRSRGRPPARVRPLAGHVRRGVLRHVSRGGELLLALAWTAALAIAVYVVLRRAVGSRA